jgi:PAS domain-containing protein
LLYKGTSPPAPGRYVPCVSQRPIELILARNLLSSLSTPAFLVDQEGGLIFYNDAAGTVLGKRFEEAGRMRPEEWGTAFGPVDASGGAIGIEQLPLTLALRRGRPAHSRFQIRSLDGADHEIEVSAVPIVTTEGTSGAMAIFWPVGED